MAAEVEARECYLCKHFRYNVKLAGSDGFYFCSLSKRPTRPMVTGCRKWTDNNSKVVQLKMNL